MNLERRLQKIETSLSPQQATMLWLDEAQRFPSYREYLQDMAREPITEAPREKVPRQAAEAMRYRVMFEPWPTETKTKVVSEAREQTDFLVVLVFIINNQVLDQLDRSVLLLWALWEQRSRMSQQGRHLKLSSRAEWTFWRQMLVAHLSQLRVLKAAIAALGATRFNGQCVVFTKQAAELDGQIEETELLAKLYNKIHRAVPSWTAVNLGGAPDPDETRALVRELEDLARAEVLIASGEGHAARTSCAGTRPSNRFRRTLATP